MMAANLALTMARSMALPIMTGTLRESESLVRVSLA